MVVSAKPPSLLLLVAVGLDGRSLSTCDKVSIRKIAVVYDLCSEKMARSYPRKNPDPEKIIGDVGYLTHVRHIFSFGVDF